MTYLHGGDIEMVDKSPKTYMKNMPGDNIYRGYFLTNMYISQIQCGIQSFHCQTEMFLTHPDERATKASSILWNWARDHKVVWVLNGGDQATLEQTYSEFMELGGILSLPTGRFYEEKDALNGALTCIGIIVPESVYEAPMPDENTAVLFDDPSKPAGDTMVGEDILGRDITDMREVKWVTEKEAATLCLKQLLSQFRFA